MNKSLLVHTDWQDWYMHNNIFWVEYVVWTECTINIFLVDLTTVGICIRDTGVTVDHLDDSKFQNSF